MSRPLRIIGWLSFAWAAFVAVGTFWPSSFLPSVLVFAALVKKRKLRFWAHGTARWATAADIPPARGGILLGRLGRELIRVEPVHTVLFAPTGVGKGVSFIIPHLLSCPDSCVVIDFKGELAAATARHRQNRFGHQIVLLNPFRVLMKTGEPLHGFKADSYNVFDGIKRDDADLIDSCRALADAMVVIKPGDKDPHWPESAKFNIHAICSYVCQYAPEDDRSLQTVRDIVAHPVLRSRALADLQASDVFGGLLARLGSQLTHYQEKELSSVLTTTNRYLQFLDSIAVQECTEKSSFDPAQLRRGRMTIYLILPPEHMRSQSQLLRLWVSSLMLSVVKGGLA